MFGLGPQELILILVIVLVIFGGNKLPELARSLGKGVREFKRESEKIKDEYNEVTESDSYELESEEEPSTPASKKQPEESEKTSDGD